MRAVVGKKGALYGIDHWPNPGQTIVSWLSMKCNRGVVGEVEEFLNLYESLSGDPRCDGEVVVTLIQGPVIVQLWEMIQPHQNV